jgi:hypothetical protein
MLFQLPLLEYFNILTNINTNTIFVIIITIIISYGIYNFSSNLGSKIIKHIPIAGRIVVACESNLGSNLKNLYDNSKNSGSSGGGSGGSKDEKNKDDKSKDDNSNIDNSKESKSTEPTSF